MAVRLWERRPASSEVSIGGLLMSNLTSFFLIAITTRRLLQLLYISKSTAIRSRFIIRVFCLIFRFVHNHKWPVSYAVCWCKAPFRKFHVSRHQHIEKTRSSPVQLLQMGVGKHVMDFVGLLLIAQCPILWSMVSDCWKRAPPSTNRSENQLSSRLAMRGISRLLDSCWLSRQTPP